MLRRIRFRLRRSIAFLAALLLALPLQAQTPGSGPARAGTCQGQDLLRTMPAGTRAELEAAAKSEPFPVGNHWLATRGDSTIHLIGTFHVYDPRMTPHMRKLMPVLHKADKILLEATEAEMARLKRDLATRPDMLFVTGPTLPERLPAAEWEQLRAELSARGIPGILAAKFQPWYVSMILSLPPCAAAQMSEGSTGLDHMIIAAAAQMGTPTAALEPYDTVFRVFGGMTAEEQLDSVRVALATAPMASDLLTTMTEAYFREEHRLLWELSRQQSVAAAKDADQARADFAVMEDGLINRRNADWVDRIRAEAPGRTLVVAVGAGHLAGHKGLLNLLAEDGYEIRRQDF